MVPEDKGDLHPGYNQLQTCLVIVTQCSFTEIIIFFFIEIWLCLIMQSGWTLES